MISRWVLRVTNVWDQNCRENQNTFLLSKSPPLPRKSCHLWDNIKKLCTAGQATGDNITRRMRFSCWITKVRNRHSEYVIIIIIFSKATLVSRARLIVLFRRTLLRMLALYHLYNLRRRHYRHCSEVVYRHSTTSELAGHAIHYRTVIYCFSFSKQCSVLEVHSCTDCWEILFPLWYPCWQQFAADLFSRHFPTLFPV
jgi:hypothetical protein